MGIKEERHTNNNDGIYTMKKKKKKKNIAKVGKNDIKETGF